jgi:hypothetical protein
MATRIVPGLPTAATLLAYILAQIEIQQGDIDGGAASTTFENSIDGGTA